MPPIISKQRAIAVKKPSTMAQSVLDRIAPMDFTEDFVKIMVYGGSGTGKTSLAGTFPGPLLWMICSGGSKPGELKSLNTPELRKKIKQVAIQESSEMATVIDYANAGHFSTLVLDHVSGLQDLTIKEILKIDKIPEQKGWGLAKQQEWGQSTAQCKEIIRALLSVDNCNVVIIGQQRRNGDKDESEMSDVIAPTIGVATTPSLAGWLNPAVDYICQTFIRPKMVHSTLMVAGKPQESVARGEGVEFCIRIAPHDIITTKFRVPMGTKLPEIMVDPTYEKIRKLLPK